MRVKTYKLSGPALDWAVSKADNPPGREGGMDWWERDANGYLFDPLNECTHSPSTNWSQGGPIIEREKISTTINDSGVWVASMDYNYSDYPLFMQGGPSALIAAMRCYVTSKLGDEVDVPDELV